MELINVDANHPAAFGLDTCRPDRIRDFVRWDRRAVLIDCDPVLSREQKAATLLQSLDRAPDPSVVRAILEAMREGTPLPDKLYELELERARSCQVTALREFGAELGDATLLALRNAYHALDPAPHHVAPGAAWRQFWK